MTITRLPRNRRKKQSLTLRENQKRGVKHVLMRRGNVKSIAYTVGARKHSQICKLTNSTLFSISLFSIDVSSLSNPLVSRPKMDRTRSLSALYPKTKSRSWPI